MASDTLYAAFTMDCEAIERLSPQGGPKAWEQSERSIRNFGECVLAAGMKPTFFIVAEAAEKHQKLFGELAQKGAELGLHCHPQNDGFADFLGGYHVDKQKEIIEISASKWERVFGRRPMSFRAGNTSTNNDTFMALLELGFRQGSVSMPGRRHWAWKAMWENALPYAHHVDPLDALVAGTAEFYEVPITSDFEKPRIDGNLYYSPRHLCLDDADLPTYADAVIQKNLARMTKDNVDIRSAVFVTDTRTDFPDVHGSLAAMVEQVKRSAQANGMKIMPATIEDIHKAADERFRDKWRRTKNLT